MEKETRKEQLIKAIKKRVEKIEATLIDSPPDMTSDEYQELIDEIEGLVKNLKYLEGI